MSDKRTADIRKAPLLDVTFNIITNKSDRFISTIATRRKPSSNEVARCDWHCTMQRGGLRIHVVGRGDELSEIYLRQLAAAYADGLPVWKSVDLSKPEAPIGGFFESATWQEIMKAVNS